MTSQSGEEGKEGRAEGKSNPDTCSESKQSYFPRKVWTYSLYFLLFSSVTKKEQETHTHNKECGKS